MTKHGSGRRGKNAGRPYHKFTTKEDAWLRKHYPTALWPKIFARFPDLSKGQIEGHARRELNLFRARPGYGVQWPTKDQKILADHYPRTPQKKLMTMLPGRTWKSIQIEAARRKIQREVWGHGKKWSTADKKRFSAMYPTATVKELLEAFPGRNENQLRTMATHLKIEKQVYWTDERKAVLKALWPNGSREDIKTAFPGKSWESISARARKLEVRRVVAAKASTPALTPEQEEAARLKAERDKMTEFLARARTEEDFAQKFGKGSSEKLLAILNEPPSGFIVASGLNRFQEKTFYLSRVQPGRGGKTAPAKKSVFTIQHSKNDPDYIAVIFPPELSFSPDPTKDALRLFPIDSSYWGDHLCDKERLTGYINWLESKPYAFAFLNGGNIGGTRYNKFNAESIRDEFIEFLRPVAHKIMWAQSGDLELRMQRIDNINPLEHVCNELGIYHTVRPVMADIYWKDPTQPIEIVAVHGRSNAHLIGSKVNAVNKVAIPHNFPHFTVMGRLMAGHSEANTVRRLDPVNLEVKEHVAYSVLAPGFRRHEGSVQEQKGYAPTPKGTVAIIIRANNEFMASS